MSASVGGCSEGGALGGIVRKDELTRETYSACGAQCEEFVDKEPFKLYHGQIKDLSEETAWKEH